MKSIPFNIPYQAKNQDKYVIDSLHSRCVSGDGPYTKKATNLLKNIFSNSKALLTPSCTSALK